MKLDGKVAIITGGGSGIGRATSLLFSKEGAKVVISDINEESGASVQKEIQELGHEAIFVKTDVSKADDIKALIDRTISRFGRIDILYNNAGIPQEFKLIEDIDENFVDRIIDVNIKGPFLGSKYAVPIMKEQKNGVILFTSSMTGVRPMPGTNLYATTKGAEVTMAKALAIELAPYNIRVNALCPVAVDSPMLPSFITNKDKEAGKKELMNKFPLGRLVTPEEVASAALYLASDESQMITGTALQLDGGRGI
ncbi:3-oxoacyl-ACP reductase [Bacillus sp. M6-12]|uniref:SDR family oxidoreductase n=1 Tax=Bacillus sp. M6-12 TaxID=2054166 RepID=UPI000C756A6D|nr:SDR family oxidoreductase [Bacillus sp. M6-12]PLS18575.1 3-oxoacyl-ACP reductase [Bacillus sp. M6-12]